MTIEFDWSPVNLIATGIGLIFLLYGSVSYLIKERLFLGEAFVAVLFGIALGPYGLAGSQGWFDKDKEPDRVGLALSRLILAVQLVLSGTQLEARWPWTHIKSLFVMLVPVMTLMWIATTLCVYLAIPDLPILAGLVVSSALTPTDPILANALVKGKFAEQYVSPRIRNLLSAESGANDGFAYPFLYLAVHLLTIDSTTEALKTWLLETCLYTVAGSVAYGILVGYICRKLLDFSTRRDWIDKESFLLYGAAMGIFLVGSAGLLQFDDLLAAFVAGNALSWDDFYREQCEESEVDNCVDLGLNMVFFTFIGATIPWDSFNAPEYGITPGDIVLMCVLVLLLRRLPAMLAFWRFVPTITDYAEACFVGYFAPIGAGAFFYMEHIINEFKDDDSTYTVRRILETVKPVTYALILSSLIGHTCAIPLLKLFLEYRGIGSIRLEGADNRLSRSSFAPPNDEEEDHETEAQHGSANGQDEAHEGEGSARAHPPGGSFRWSTSHRRRSQSRASLDDPEAARQKAQQPTQERGAFRSDGTWDENASWRHSSGHKLAACHEISRRGRRDSDDADARAREGYAGSSSFSRDGDRGCRNV